jgi:hypothetical protein
MAKWIINRNGRASAIDCDDVIRDRNGRFCLWINNGKMFDKNGNQVGWVDNGVFYDSNNNVIGYTNDHTGTLPSTPGIAAMPAAMPAFGARPAFRPVFNVNNERPGYGGWSNTLIENYISEN